MPIRKVLLQRLNPVLRIGTIGTPTSIISKSGFTGSSRGFRDRFKVTSPDVNVGIMKKKNVGEGHFYQNVHVSMIVGKGEKF